MLPEQPSAESDTLATSAKQVSLRIALTNEQLVALLRMLGATHLPGFQPEWAPRNLQGEYLATAFDRLETASRTLIATGLLVPPVRAETGETYSMPATLAGMIGSCAFASSTILLRFQYRGKPHEVYIYQMNDLAILRTMPMPGLHVFTCLGSRSSITPVIRSYFQLTKQQAVAFTPTTLETQALQIARGYLANGALDRALRTLKNYGCDEDSARTLLDAVAHPLVTGILSVGDSDDEPDSPLATKRRKSQKYPSSVALIVNESAIFLLRDAEKSPQTHVDIRSFDVDEVTRYLEMMW